MLRLLDLAETNTEHPDGAAVTPKISQSTLASMVGVSRGGILNRAIGALVGRGIRSQGKRTLRPRRSGCPPS